MSCSSDVKPLQLTYQNITLTNDGRAQSNGIAVQIGTPLQTFSLTPTMTLNNTFVNNIATCGSESNSACISVIGGGYDASGSSTFTSATPDTWNGSTEVGDDALLGVSAVYFNDVVAAASQDLSGFPLLIEATDVNLYAGLGLGKNSTFISRLLEANLVPSRSWSLFPGMYSATGAGSLIIGGYAERFYTGQLHQKNLSDTDYTPNWEITGMEYQTESTSVDLLPNDIDGPFIGVVDSYYPTLTVPNEIFWKWGNVTNGTWAPEILLHSYSADNAPAGNLTVTLANGLKTVIPNEALLSPPAYDNGVLSALVNDSDSRIYSVFQQFGNVNSQHVTSSAVLGIPYAAMVYMIMDRENQQLSIANANQAAQIGGDAITICGSGSSRKGDDSDNTGAIAGGVVGGIVGLALITLSAWFLWRRKKTSARAEDPSTAYYAGDMGKAELPEYNAVDHVSPPEMKTAGYAAAQEMPAQHARTEMEDTQTDPAKELPADRGNMHRSELPA